MQHKSPTENMVNQMFLHYVYYVHPQKQSVLLTMYKSKEWVISIFFGTLFKEIRKLHKTDVPEHYEQLSLHTICRCFDDCEVMS